MGRACGDQYENVEKFIASDCFDYLPPLKQNILSFGLDFGYYSRFVESARESGRYDYIVIGTDSVFNEDKNALFALANKVIVTVNQDRYSYYKVCKFLDNLGAGTADKCMYICNKFRSDSDNAFRKANANPRIVLDGYVDFEEGCEQKDVFDLLDSQSFRRLIGFIC